MKLEEILETAAEVIRRVKADKVRRGRGERGECEVRPSIVVYRGDEQVVFAQAPDRDAALGMAKFAASGYDADVLVFIMDAWQVGCASEAAAGTNPVTGRRWGPGEMQDAVENHGALEKGWVAEGIQLMGLDRTGAMLGLMCGYRMVKRHVEWEESRWMRDGSEGFAITGLIPDALQEAMTAIPSFRVTMEGMGHSYASFGMRDEGGRARQDCMVTRMIHEKVARGAVAIFARAGGLREAVIREWLPEGEIIRPTRPPGQRR